MRVPTPTELWINYTVSAVISKQQISGNPYPSEGFMITSHEFLCRLDEIMTLA